MKIRSIATLASVAATLCMCVTSAAFAAPATPRAGWAIHSVAEPTSFNFADTQDTVYELVVEATEGHYKLHFGFGVGSTVAISSGATAEEVQKALEELPEVGRGNVAVAGGPRDASGSKQYTITLTGTLSGGYLGFLNVEEAELKNGGTNGSATPTTATQPIPRDRIAVAVVNVGSRSSEGNVTIADELPPGLTLVRKPKEPEVEEPVSKKTAECSPTELTCTYPKAVLPGRELVLHAYVAVTSPALTGLLVNRASVSGGGGGEASTSAASPVNLSHTPFGLAGFTFEADGVAGTLDSQAGDHPYGVTTTIELNTALEAAESPYLPQEPQVVQGVKDVAVDLPLGFAGDPLATEQCPEIDLTDSEGNVNTSGYHTACPAGSQVGTVSIVWAGGFHTVPYPIYNVVPEHGYPAELGFNAAAGQPIFLYASVVHDRSGYRLQVATPDALRVTNLEPEAIRVDIFGDPGAVDGTGSKAAFVTNPTNCPTKPLSVSTYVSSWDGSSATEEATAYPELTGCDLLQGSAAFDPSFGIEPETTQADTPSGYTAALKLPQAPSVFGALATPELKDATITLPAGMSISPSAASGPDALAGCAATGADGINIGSDEVGPEGRDVGDPEATELGAGHPGGENERSPYDDGMWHTAPGHCPQNSRIGEVEVKTPDLAEPLRGHVYLMNPLCGGAGQPVCTEEAAETGGVFGLYLEITGSGLIIKVPGSVEVGGYGAHSVSTGLAPGQLRARFDEAPQFPVEDVKLVFPGGPRAALANPQSCGTFTATSDLTPSSAPETPDATPFSSFPISSGCGGGFAPAFSAGTVTQLAGSYSPFTLTFSRNDGEQDLSEITVSMPNGLLGKIAGIEQCPEAQANAGDCPAASRVGTATAAAGSGSQPFYQSGPVYLTGPYNGAPFGLAVVVPANAGPYHLGNIVVRAAIHINPVTAAVSVTSNPLPQMIDGVPLRVKTVNVTVGEGNNFTFNPTNCTGSSVNATITSAQGAQAAVSSPFAAAGCANLKFTPKFSVSTSGTASKADGASLTTTVIEPAEAFGSQANIAKVKVELPKDLPSRLTTLQKACTSAQFEANPAGCPSASFIGHAVVHTALLPVPLEGPAIFVSHGGEAFPSLTMVLQGDNVTFDLVGTTFISKAGITSTTFKAVPDVPFNTFSLTLPQGPYSALAANGNLCTEQSSLKLPVQFVGQNNATLNEDAQVAVAGCKPEIRVVKHSVKGKTATLVVSVPSAGKLVATGKGLIAPSGASKATKSTSSATGATLTLKLTLSKGEVAFLKKHKGRKLEAKIRLTFTPKHGAHLKATTTVDIG